MMAIEAYYTLAACYAILYHQSNHIIFLLFYFYFSFTNAMKEIQNSYELNLLNLKLFHESYG